MRESINKETLKKVTFISVNYQIIINTLPMLLFIIMGNILDNPLNMSIQKYTLVAILWTITIPPILEELLFRKFLYGKLKNKFKTNTAIIISSLIFGLVHFNLLVAIFAYGIGVISCKIYDKTGEIKYSILFHSVANFFSIIFHNYVKFNIFNGYFNLSTIQIILTIILFLSVAIYMKYSSKLLTNI